MTALAETRAPRRTLASACAAHALHDGLIDSILVFLPIFQAQFALSFAAVGFLRATANGTMAAMQIPAGHLAGRIGGRATLVLGTLVAGGGYLAASLSSGLLTLLAGLALIGLGASVQHPIASELISGAYASAQRRMALGIYNFTGDVGKTILPPTAALLLTVLDWRIVCATIFAIALAIGLSLLAALPDEPFAEPAADAGGASAAITDGRMTPFRVLLAIGVCDSAVRMAFLTFLPFLLTAKGGSIETTGLALSLIFFGGAAGKFVCAWLGARIGPIPTVILTEFLTAVAIAAVAVLPLAVALACLPLLGVALNGTSSVLYGSVAELVPEQARRRAFALFYTATIGAGAIAPVVAGLFIDRAGLAAMLGLTALVALLVIPLALVLRPAFRALDA